MFYGQPTHVTGHVLKFRKDPFTEVSMESILQ